MAHAHAALPGAVSVSPDGKSIALSLPGFGMVVRNGDAWAYACDAVLGLAPSVDTPAMALRKDGTRLLGSVDGLRVMTPDGCATASEGALRDEPVFALAFAGDIGYAIAGDGAWRSEDEGRSWTLRSPLTGGDQVTGFAVDPVDPQRVYMTRGMNVVASTDGAETFATSPQERALTLLQVTHDELYAGARSLTVVGNRGYDVLHASTPVGPWTILHSVNYFGGFNIDANGTFWIGEELGGLFRSEDGGTYTNVAGDVSVSCLTNAAGAAWACAPDISTGPSLYEVRDQITPALSLINVDHLVSCPNVERLCAAAWFEWQRDVLMRDPYPDAGSVVDAGSILDASVPDASVMREDASVSKHASDGCSLARSDNAPWFLLLALMLLRRQRLRAGASS